MKLVSALAAIKFNAELNFAAQTATKISGNEIIGLSLFEIFGGFPLGIPENFTSQFIHN